MMARLEGPTWKRKVLEDMFVRVDRNMASYGCSLSRAGQLLGRYPATFVLILNGESSLAQWHAAELALEGLPAAP